jgi:hypothetical protein
MLVPRFLSFCGGKAECQTVIGHVSALVLLISFAYCNDTVNQNLLLVCQSRRRIHIEGIEFTTRALPSPNTPPPGLLWTVEGEGKGIG